ncbi:hypothetical protein GY15_08560 [Delftia sp. 670]|nr:hypothetical protein GY15_08560 [Delftia sp. 670]
MGGALDQRGAVQVGHDLHVGRQQLAVELLHGGMDALQRLRGVGALEQQHDALQGVGVAVLAQDAAPLHVAVGQTPQVLDQHGRAAVRGLDDHVAHVVQRAQQAHAAHHIGDIAPVDDAAAAAGVVGIDGLDHLGQRQPVLQQPRRVQLQHELRGQAAEVGHVHHGLGLLQARDHHPLLQLGQLAQAAHRAFQRVAVDLARGRAVGVQPGAGTIGQRDLVDALLQALARPVAVHAVLEDHGDQRQREQAARAQHVHAGRGQQGALQRNGDLLLYLLGRQAWHLGDDLRGHVAMSG